MINNELNIALIGNPNSGKTLLFNNLTGSSQTVGNWPGVTVEKKEGIKKYKGRVLKFIDLPGKYSFSASSYDEKVTKDYLMTKEPQVVLNIVNGTSLTRHLYLTMQLIEMELPVILVVNMIDELEKTGQMINYEALEKELGIKVFPISAKSKKGIKDLLDYLVTINNVEVNCTYRFSKDIEHVIREIEIKENISRAKAIRYVEGDYSDNFKEEFTIQMTKERYIFIKNIVSLVLLKKEKSENFTNVLDSILLAKLTGIPIFLLVMSLVFYLTFYVGNYFVDLIDLVITDYIVPFSRTSLLDLGVTSWLTNLIVDGVLSGVGGVVTFVPNIAMLFLFISFLEDSGYMARAAYIIDRFMQRIGLNGKFFIPMLVGFGCNVPGIIATRTLSSRSERLIAILINPFMSCGARFPVYVLFAGIFFRGYETLVIMSLYLLGVIIAIIMAFVLKSTILKSESQGLLIELPNYRLPSIKSLYFSTWIRVKDYLTKAGTVILVASVLLWFILNFNFSGMSQLKDSFGAEFGKLIAPIFTFAGFGNWESALSLISGIFAKEIVISNTAIIYGLSETGSLKDFGEVLSSNFNMLSAYSFMVFVLLYTPCVAVIGVIKRETGSWGYTIFSVVYQFIIALIVSSAIYQIGLVIFH
jgi:ferrous iron transport protein B